MKIIEYNDKYLEDVRDLLTELEEYLVSIDKDNLDRVHPEYHEKMAIIDLEDVRNNSGKCYLAIEDGKAIGLIMGTIVKFSEYDYLDYKCPKEGEITELIVTKKIRSTGVGKALMEKLEEYFISQDCEYIMVDIFAYNDNAIGFYNNRGYHNRMHRGIKKIEKRK
jgi:ribosomal protein S18 acetylase RimI-like enzyme